MTSQLTWRRLAAVGILLGLASLIATTLLQWMLQAGASSPTSAAHDEPSLWLLCGLLAVFGPLAWAAGVAVLTMQVRERGWVLTTIGGAVTALGFGIGAAHLSLFFGLFADLAGPGVGDGAATAVMRADDGDPLTAILLIGFLVGFSLGPIILMIGLRRAHRVAIWVPVAALIAAVANFVGGPIAGAVQLAALLATFLPAVLMLLRREDRAVPTASV
ncbi:hypothetical protein GCM10009840_16640 [Pseudolysinimonas kribbensis]|uniref:DUF4386 family protein n=1 Tax=Pseudolysinimonas kribbensis TaxID=433641 RepID=A0ABQ6K208_9MICO|nr:hypothetical protein [Pseudolysinimonas kribbensis]GMA93967.1 hypothetical protein GCM10025881_07910 [Pseudolysinimonas kribbensis]